MGPGCAKSSPPRPPPVAVGPSPSLSPGGSSLSQPPSHHLTTPTLHTTCSASASPHPRPIVIGGRIPSHRIYRDLNETLFRRPPSAAIDPIEWLSGGNTTQISTRNGPDGQASRSSPYMASRRQSHPQQQPTPNTTVGTFPCLSLSLLLRPSRSCLPHVHINVDTTRH